LVELLAILFSQEAEFSPHPQQQTDGLRLIMDNDQVGRVVVARDEHRLIAGMAIILYTVSTYLGTRVGILEDLVVDPAMRGQGVGSQLLAFAIKTAVGNGCSRITLLTDGDNLSAHAFYMRHGFKRSPMVPFRMLLLET